MSVLMAGLAAGLFTLGTYLLLQRKLSRVIIGIGLLGHGANVLFVNAGRRGRAPLIGSGDPAGFADPTPQALVLTAIVISFGVTALLLALAYRSWVLTDDDEVADDVEDRAVARQGFADRELADEAALAADLDSATEDDEPDDPWHEEHGEEPPHDAEAAGAGHEALLPLPVLLPLAAAAVSILVGRSRTWQRIVSISTLTAVVGLAVAIVVVVDREGTVSTQAGGWPAPLGITLVADRFSAVMLLVASVVLLAVVIYAVGQPGAERNHVGFQSVYLVLAAGVAAAFLTGDLFNLFVAIEMMLTASYVLITLGGRLDQVRSGMTYVVISLVASILFLAALAFTYSATGTVNLAELSLRMAELPAGVQGGLAALFLVVFGIKAGLFPLYFWLPDSYPTAPSPVTAIFAGLLTKVGVYAIVRTQTLLFPGVLPTWLVMTIAGATMVVGVLGAIAQDDVKRILSFHIISHIGYMLMGLGLATVAGLAGAVFYTVHHILVKTTLFLTGGLIEHQGGSSRLSKLGNMVRTAPLLAVLFLVPALSLAGIPPMSGFIAKLSLVDAAAASHQWPILGVSVVVSLLTIFALMKIWTGVFWAPTDDEHAVPAPGAVRSRLGGPPMMVVPTIVLALGTVVLGLASGPLYAYSTRAAEQLVDPAGYVATVEALMARVAAVVGLAAIWVLAWGSLSPANVLGGLAVGIVLMAVSPDAWPRVRWSRARPVAVARLVGHVLVEAARANVALTRVILSREANVTTGVIAVPIPNCSDGLLTLVTNLLALTPGTMPLEVEKEPTVIYVHALLLGDVESTRREVQRVAALAFRAFASDEAIAALEAARTDAGSTPA